jgi:hypothetical protein
MTDVTPRSKGKRREKPSTHKRVATELHSKIVRSRGMCERCGDTRGPFDAAHIVPRRYSATRTRLDNAWCLCRPCHTYLDSHPVEKVAFAGLTLYRYLQAIADAGLEGQGMSPLMFWRQERENLTRTAKELGL